MIKILGSYRALALGFLAFCLAIIDHSIRVVVDEEAAFLGLGALVGEGEQLQGSGEVVIDGELLTHLDIPDPAQKLHDDGLV